LNQAIQLTSELAERNRTESMGQMRRQNRTVLSFKAMLQARKQPGRIEKSMHQNEGSGSSFGFHQKLC
jgi:hypothetical protein